MKKIVIAFAAILLTGTIAFAQNVSKGDLKKFDEARAQLDKYEYVEPEKTLSKLVKKYPQESDMWDMLVTARYYDYLVFKHDHPEESMSVKVSVKGGDGSEAVDSVSQALATQLSSMMQDFTPVGMKRMAVVNTCREATMKAPLASYADMLLRNMKIDLPKDTAVDPEAEEQYQIAEKEFGKGNYKAAINYYKKAIEFEPSYYKARLYLGDTYYMLKDYRTAAAYFREAIEVMPTELEPRKYLVDALYYSGKYEEAFTECKEGIIVYPDATMFDKLHMVADKLGRGYNRGWLPRGAFPNVIGKKRDEKEEIEKGWKAYVDAKEKIEPFCNNVGAITKPTSLTNSKYAEVYAWEELLRSAPQSQFTEAREWMAKGYLDCYVFVSLYHFDLYPQYKDFAANNKDRILAYLDLVATK